jgi:ABC-type polysaccharide/polyol phosphate transport system ATPase subunit
MNNDFVFKLDQVSLCYRLAKQRLPSFKEYAINWIKGSLVYEQLWALKEVSIQVGRGESVGVVGRNGAGKSTLLKVVSGVLKPTEGQVARRGTVAPVFELGTGFDHELTGVENIFLNALLLGRRRSEIKARLDPIVEFSGLGDLIRSPLRNYSSGMIARLGFAIATAWVTDVLILDEVLAVGDAAFIKQCEKRLHELRDKGTTFLLVSHDPEAVAANCGRCIWLDEGFIMADGSTRDVLAKYADFTQRAGVEAKN